MSAPSPNITLRPVTDRDTQFLLSVYAGTRKAELSLTTWTKEQCEAFVSMQFNAQQLHYSTNYPEGEHSIILVNGQPVGRLYVARLENKIHILDITVLEEYGNEGTGSWVLKSLMSEALEAGKFVTVYVEFYNRSLRLFERLGFIKAEETDLHWLMKWPASEASPKPNSSVTS